MSGYIKIFGATEIGSVREENQDAVFACGCIAYDSGAQFEFTKSLDSRITVGVIDGMGGYLGGNEAAGTTALHLSCVESMLSTPEWTELMNDISNRIVLMGKVLEMPKMGAVCAVLCFSEEGMLSVNVGDCRSYRLVDDYFVQMSVDDRSDIPGSNALTQALGVEGREVKPHCKFFPYGNRTERYLICSDGLYGTLGREDMQASLANAGTLADIGHDLIRMTYSMNPQDNFSFCLIEVGFEEESCDDDSKEVLVDE